MTTKFNTKNKPTAAERKAMIEANRLNAEAILAEAKAKKANATVSTVEVMSDEEFAAIQAEMQIESKKADKVAVKPTYTPAPSQFTTTSELLAFLLENSFSASLYTANDCDRVYVNDLIGNGKVYCEVNQAGNGLYGGNNVTITVQTGQTRSLQNQDFAYTVIENLIIAIGQNTNIKTK